MVMNIQKHCDRNQISPLNLHHLLPTALSHLSSLSPGLPPTHTHTTVRLQNPPSHCQSHCAEPEPTSQAHVAHDMSKLQDRDPGGTAASTPRGVTDRDRTAVSRNQPECLQPRARTEHLNKKPTLLGSSQGGRESQSARDIRKFTGGSAGAWEAAGRTKQGRPPQLSPPTKEEPQETRGSVQTQAAQSGVHTANPHLFSRGHSDTVHSGASHLVASNFWNLL